MNSQHEHVVHEVVGVDLEPREAAAALGFGAVSLFVAGVLPALLGALGDEHRLSEAAIGECATLEALSMGISTALAGILIAPRRLRLIGALCAVLLAIVDAAGIGLREEGILVARTLAGVPEGVLLWITVGMIARSQTPERWAGALFTSSTASQLILALAFAFVVIPRYGADGGFAVLAGATLIGAINALWVPDSYAPLPGGEDGAGMPPVRGWIALAATLLFVSSGAAVAIYLQPLAHEAGLSADTARTALWISLAAQIAGGASATILAGRIRYLPIFIGTALVFVLNWSIMAMHPPGWAFVAVNAAGGFVSVLSAPFLVPMTIEADPSRRAAVQSAGAQLLASALGPFLASQLVSDSDVHGALMLGTALLLASLVVISGLHVIALRDRSSLQRASI
jgi:hypothetical protein